jgi:hypothetical protein
MGAGRRLIGWIAAYALVLHAVLAGIVATQASVSRAGAHAFELCLTDPDGAALPGQSQHEHCAIHCAAAGAVPVLLLALLAVLFPVPAGRRLVALFPMASVDLLRRAGLGSRAPPLPA